MVIWYFVRNLALSIVFFFKHWYLDGFFAMTRVVSRVLGSLEKSLALKVNLYFFFQPLYQERNIYGYAIGLLYRSLILLFGGMLYAAIILAGVAAYLTWAAIPAYIIYRIFYG